MKHRIVTAAQMKAIEQAGNAHGLPYLQMMENAGLAAYAELKTSFRSPALCWWSAERATTAGTVLSSPAPPQRGLECDCSFSRRRTQNHRCHHQF